MNVMTWLELKGAQAQTIGGLMTRVQPLVTILAKFTIPMRRRQQEIQERRTSPFTERLG
jgi:hypothetical protein